MRNSNLSPSEQRPQRMVPPPRRPRDDERRGRLEQEHLPPSRPPHLSRDEMVRSGRHCRPLLRSGIPLGDRQVLQVRISWQIDKYMFTSSSFIFLGGKCVNKWVTRVFLVLLLLLRGYVLYMNNLGISRIDLSLKYDQLCKAKQANVCQLCLLLFVLRLWCYLPNVYVKNWTHSAWS